MTPFRLQPGFGCQIGVRVLSRIAEVPTPCADPESAVDYWHKHVAGADWFDLEKEHLVVLVLNTKYRVKAWHLVGIGTLNEAVAHPREIFRPAIAASAFAIILAHNHPSGDPAPSEADLRLTRRIKEAGDLLQIPLLDHVVIGAGPEAFYSFKKGDML